MSTKTQQFLPVLALGFLFGSCNSAPEAIMPATTVALQGATPECPASESTRDEARRDEVPPVPSPLVEARRPSVRLAVIHHRPAPRVTVPATPVMARRIVFLRRQAEAARAHFAFADAARRFRALRDDAATPVAMRAEFHAALGESDDIAYGLHEIRRALDALEYEKASRRYRAISLRHPRVPFAVLLGFQARRVIED